MDTALEVLATTEQARVRVFDSLAAPLSASPSDTPDAVPLAQLHAEYVSACAAADAALAHAPEDSAADATVTRAVELGCGQALAGAALAAALQQRRARTHAAAIAHAHRVAAAHALWLRDAATQAALLTRGTGFALLQRALADTPAAAVETDASARAQLDRVRAALHARRLRARTPGAARALLDGVRTGTGVRSGDVAGYLYTRGARRRDWARRYCALDAAAGTFAVCDAPGEAAVPAVDVALVAGRASAPDSGAFELVTFRDGARAFLAWAPSTARTWLRAIDAARARRLEQVPVDVVSDADAEEKDGEKEKEEQETQPMSPSSLTASTSAAKHLEWLYSLEGANRECADCGAARPEWTVLQHGCLVCIRCAGVHRALGVHVSAVRSLLLDAGTRAPGLVAALGNAHARALLEHALPAALDRAPLRASAPLRTRFITAKYRARAFAARAALPAPRCAAALAEAVAANDVRRAHFFFLSGADVAPGADTSAETEPSSPPLLCIAAEHGAVAVGAFLLANGAPVCAADARTGRTPLHCAVACDCVALAALLVRAGADLHAHTHDGETPADIAARTGAGACAALLARAAEEEARDPRAQRLAHEEDECGEGDEHFLRAMEPYVTAARASQFVVPNGALLQPPLLSLDEVLRGEPGAEESTQSDGTVPAPAGVRKRKMRELCTSLEDTGDSPAL